VGPASVMSFRPIFQKWQDFAEKLTKNKNLKIN